MSLTRKTRKSLRTANQASWWRITEEWKHASQGLQHGEIEDRTQAFATARNITADTLRRYAAARRFVEKLAAEGHGLEAATLSKLRVSSLGVLQRMRHHGHEVVVENARALVSGKLTHGDLLQVEGGLRRAASGAARSGAQNRHAFRIMESGFRPAALAALAASLPAGTVLLPRDKVASAFAPLYVDAVAREADGTLGTAVRIIGGVATKADPDRMRVASLFAIAAARVFSRYVLLAQSADDAAALSAVIAGIGACGVSVMTLDAEGRIAEVHCAARLSTPDLAQDAAWAARLTLPPAVQPEAVAT